MLLLLHAFIIAEMPLLITCFLISAHHRMPINLRDYKSQRPECHLEVQWQAIYGMNSQKGKLKRSITSLFRYCTRRFPKIQHLCQSTHYNGVRRKGDEVKSKRLLIAFAAALSVAIVTANPALAAEKC